MDPEVPWADAGSGRAASRARTITVTGAARTLVRIMGTLPGQEGAFAGGVRCRTAHREGGGTLLRSRGAFEARTEIGGARIVFTRENLRMGRQGRGRPLPRCP